MTAYMPPGDSLLRARNCIEYISDVLAEAKRTIENCTIILAGDFNQWPIEEAQAEHPDIREVEHGPTQRGRKIDRAFVNFFRSIEISQTLRPLETNEGTASDHKIVYVQAKFDSERPERVSYTYRRYTEEGARAFEEIMATQRWDQVYRAVDSDSKAGELDAILTRAMDRCFPFKTTTKRKTDPPWINHAILTQIRKRRKVYLREGRSQLWKRMKKKTAKLTKKRAKNYIKSQKRALLASDASRVFYKNVRSYQSKEKPPSFDVRALFPDKDDQTVSEELADHFNGISLEFDGISQADIPTSTSSALKILSKAEVESKLKKMKKPKSMVDGDIMPSVVNSVAAYLAMPLTDIYNCITVSAKWPRKWKVEYVTPIPKKTHPETVNDLRNISCTQLISKAYESFVLEWLGAQVGLRLNQYRGTKGSGMEHYLVELWQRTLENLDDPRAASVFMSIDYSKAFNRLDFKHCLLALKAKGACTELLALVASFLTERQMVVKVGNSRSAPRSVLGGVPQGSILGVFLFNVAIDCYETVSPDIEKIGTNLDQSQLGEAREMADSDVPVPPEPTECTYLHLPPFARELLQVLKYVDDNVINEKANFETIPTEVHGFRTKHLVRTQNLFRRIVAEAVARGMKVNSLKTGLMIISDSASYNPAGYIFDLEGNKITNSNSMKILGFHFSSDPDMAAQVRSIQSKFRARLWILRHLKHRGFSRCKSTRQLSCRCTTTAAMFITRH